MTIADMDLVRKRTDAITFRTPRKEDGTDVWRLIRESGPLDENSLYCNLIQCDHFGDTCVAAERKSDGMLVGWVSGYVLPDAPDTIFVWQVAVDNSAQGNGIGKRMLNALLDRDVCADVTKLKTTITDDNEASWALFSSFAKSRGGVLQREPHFHEDEHFDGEHQTEHMVTIRFDESAQDAA